MLGLIVLILHVFLRYLGLMAPTNSTNLPTPPFNIKNTSTMSSSHASEKESEPSGVPSNVSLRRLASATPSSVDTNFVFITQMTKVVKLPV